MALLLLAAVATAGAFRDEVTATSGADDACVAPGQGEGRASARSNDNACPDPTASRGGEDREPEAASAPLDRPVGTPTPLSPAPTATPTPTATSAPTAAPTPGGAPIPALGVAWVTSRVLLRQSANPESPVLSSLEAGARVEVIDSPWNEFVLVQSEAGTGWVPVSYVGSAPVAAGASLPRGPAFVVGEGGTVLRSEPDGAAGLIRTLRSGERVDVLGEAVGGYYPVAAGAATGWVDVDRVAAGSRPAPARTHEAGMAYTADRVHMRKGPGLVFASEVLVDAGVTVELTGKEDNGFVEVVWGGHEGWVFVDYIIPIRAGGLISQGGSARTSDRLRLREGPGLTWATLTVMPAGAVVTLTGDARQGFYPVTFGSISGWASADYLVINATALVFPVAGGFAWPLTGPITSYFGPVHPLGIDIGTSRRTGVPVAASRAGVVTYAGGDACCSYGLYVRIDHGDGFTTLYGHLSAFRAIVGQRVAQGEVIGLSGNTGRSTGPHLHFEIRRDGVPLDPLHYLPK